MSLRDLKIQARREALRRAREERLLREAEEKLVRTHWPRRRAETVVHGKN